MARVAAAAAIATGLLVAAGFWLHLSYAPNTGKDIYDNEAAFRSYVASLGLSSMRLGEATNRLLLEGFRCDRLEEGNVSCNRRPRGSNCGELQVVDLKKPGPGGSSHSVTTRFGLTCR